MASRLRLQFARRRIQRCYFNNNNTRAANGRDLPATFYAGRTRCSHQLMRVGPTTPQGDWTAYLTRTNFMMRPDTFQSCT